MEKTEKVLLSKLKLIDNLIENVSNEEIEIVIEHWTSPFSFEEVKIWFKFDQILEMAEAIKEYRNNL